MTPTIIGTAKVKIELTFISTATTQIHRSAIAVVSEVLDRSAHTLVDAHVDQLTQRHLIALGAFVLSNSVVDNDGIIDRVTEDGQHNRDKVIVDWEAQQNKDTKGNQNIVQKCNHCHDACRSAANFSKAEADIHNHNDRCKDNGYNTFLKNSLPSTGSTLLTSSAVMLLSG